MAESENNSSQQGSEINKSKHFTIAKAQFETSIKRTDWQDQSSRRTLELIEQSCKLAARAYIFAANDKNTWVAVKEMISNFLINAWKEGAIKGATAADAFSVACGLGETMTSDDILNGIMVVTVKVAVLHPAEFIVISFQQEMAIN